MKLEEALKKSNLVKRIDNGYLVIIEQLPENQGFTTCREFKSRRIGREEFPHLGALFNNALKKNYIEIKRYANDWELHLPEPQSIEYSSYEDYENDYEDEEDNNDVEGYGGYEDDSTELSEDEQELYDHLGYGYTNYDEEGFNICDEWLGGE